MIKYFFILGLLCILHNILLYNNEMYISVILFIIPLSIFLITYLKHIKKINNKKGLLLLIPILLLSLNYLLYDDNIFTYLNIIIIPVLFTLMFIFTINPTYRITNLLNNITYIFLKPFNYIKKMYNSILNKFNINKDLLCKIKSVLIILPIIVIILLLLSSSDMIFKNIFNGMFKNIKSINFLENIFGRILSFLFIFTYIGSTLLYLNNTDLKNNNINAKEKKFNIDSFTSNALLTLLNIIYLVFDYIQINSLILHRISMNIPYATYAREGFFQLMIVSIINISIILIIKQSKNNYKNKKYKNTMCFIMVLLTTIIIISSFLRMNMYEQAYGYTTLRLLVYASLITELVILIPTILYIFDKKINLIKSYGIIILISYVVLNLIPMNYIIAKENINRYYKIGKIDIDYLKNRNTDNTPLLIELYKNEIKKKEKNEEITNLNDYYFKIMYKTSKIKKIQEFNISKYKANKKLKKV